MYGSNGKATLEAIVAKHLGHDKAGRQDQSRVLISVESEPFEKVTSFPAWILTAQLSTGEKSRFYLKDFGHSRLPKDQLPQRRWREVRVYQELLNGDALGTARFIDAIWDPPLERYWLLIEYVEGIELRSLGLAAWLQAATWLGRFHGYYLPAANRLRSCRYLLQHDEDFFWGKATRARKAVAAFPADLAQHLEVALRDYARIIEVMLRQPRTLVHGSYRPQNILLNGSSRVCPIDWELAGYGTLFYDLAFILDGFRPPELTLMLNAYRQEAAANGVSLPEDDELLLAVSCFRLHKIVKSLGDSVDFNFSQETVIKLLAMVGEVREDIYSKIGW